MTPRADELLVPAQIVLAGSPILRTPCPPVGADAWPTERVQRLGQLLLHTMPVARGVGLAANQIGVHARVAALGDAARTPAGTDPGLFALQGRVAFEPYVLVDPILTPNVDAGWSAWFEGCLSVPDYTGVVSRWNEVAVRASTPAGEPLEFVATGWHARILQHEVDHLDGRMYVDRVCTRTFMHRTEHQTRWHAQPIDAVLAALGAQPDAPSS